MIDAVKLAQVLEKTLDGLDFDCIALSGGLDSTILGYLAASRDPKAIAVATSNFESPDLDFCMLAAKHCNLKLEILHPTLSELASATKNVVNILENFNDIEIRNAAVMYVMLSRAKECKMRKIITGDGADELFAGYKFMEKMSPEKLRTDLHRVWSIMHFTSQTIAKDLGIEIVAPFLEKDLVNVAKSIDVDLKVREENGKVYGKWILRKAFESSIPHAIAWRRKDAMQDGAGTVGLSTYFDQMISNDEFTTKLKSIYDEDGVQIRSKESLYYYKIYREHHMAPSGGSCTYCNGYVAENSKYCRMCGAYPL